jgi:DNA invertase Pin-like site-specific DNA recombinase
MHMLAAFAEFERENSMERITAGIAAAKAAGVQFGRRYQYSDAQLDWARAMIFDEGKSVKDVAYRLGMSQWTLYKRLGGINQQAREDWFAKHHTAPQPDYEAVNPQEF